MQTRTLEPIIAEHPFFAGLAPEYLELVTGCAKNVRFDEMNSCFGKARRQKSSI